MIDGERMDITSEAFARRLAKLLAERRRERGKSIRSLARASGHAFTARDLQELEAARSALDVDSLDAIVKLYDADIDNILAARAGLQIRPVGVVSTGGLTAPFIPTDSRSLLLSYLKLVRQLRDQQQAPSIELRREDVEVIAEYLDEDGASVVERLAALMGATATQRRAMAGMFLAGALVIGLATSSVAAGSGTGTGTGMADARPPVTVVQPAPPATVAETVVQLPAVELDAHGGLPGATATTAPVATAPVTTVTSAPVTTVTTPAPVSTAVPVATPATSAPLHPTTSGGGSATTVTTATTVTPVTPVTEPIVTDPDPFGQVVPTEAQPIIVTVAPVTTVSTQPTDVATAPAPLPDDAAPVEIATDTAPVPGALDALAAIGAASTGADAPTVGRTSVVGWQVLKGHVVPDGGHVRASGHSRLVASSTFRHGTLAVRASHSVGPGFGVLVRATFDARARVATAWSVQVDPGYGGLLVRRFSDDWEAHPVALAESSATGLYGTGTLMIDVVDDVLHARWRQVQVRVDLHDALTRLGDQWGVDDGVAVGLRTWGVGDLHVAAAAIS